MSQKYINIYNHSFFSRVYILNNIEAISSDHGHYSLQSASMVYSLSFMDSQIQKKLDNFFIDGSPLTFHKGEVFMRAGMPLSKIYYLKTGHVRQYLNTADGQELTLHVFNPLSFFPLVLLISNTENKYDFAAIDDVLVWPKPARQVLEFLNENPDVLYDFATRLSHGIVGLLEKIEKMTYTNAYQKILSLLLYLIDHYGIPSTNTTLISLKLTHTDIASWTGMQRETASRQIEKLEKKGIIEIDKSILKIDANKLHEEYSKISAENM